ncbi:Intermembrane transport protein PqiA [Phycisphaerales bacterium]|nr:Intermembrane transport protein PqiA [Phycisphaerales bacterium]
MSAERRTTAKSLAALNPGRWWVPVGLVTALALLLTGLVLPVMRVQKLIFWNDEYTILTGVRALWIDGQGFLAVVIALFSVLFPILKLGGLLGIWLTPMEAPRRGRLLFWVDVLGRWSMLDVFVVAVTVVMMSSKAALDATPRAGLYVFAAGVGLSMVITMSMEQMGRGRRD